MAQNGAFTIGIGANIGDATKKLNALNKQLAQLQKPAKDYQKAMSRFQDLSGITKAKDGLRSMTTHALAAAESLTKIIAPLGIISGAASLAGIYKLTSAWGDFGTQILNTSKRLNMTAQSLSSWQNGARLAGVSAAAMTSGLKSLGDTMQDAVAGRNKDALVMFLGLGVNIRKATLEAKSAEDVLPELADKLASLKNPTIQAQLATKMFGGAAEEMLPFLRKGSAGIAEYRAEAVKYGVMNDESAAAANRFREDQTKLTLSVEGFGNSIIQHVAQPLGDLLTWMADLIALNRDWIAQRIGEYVKEFSDWIKSIDWKEVWNGIKEWIKWGADLIKSMGGIKQVSEDLLLLWAGSKVVGLLGNLASIAGAFGLIRSEAKLASLASGALLPILAAVAAAKFIEYSYKKGQEDMGPAGPGKNEKAPPGTFGNPLSWLGIGKPTYPIPFSGSGGGGNTTSTAIPAEGRALLDTIASGESQSYADIYGTKTKITDFSKHPGLYEPITSGPHTGETSSAAGRYQFIKSTWDEEATKLGLKDFSPASQDAAAWDKAQSAYKQKYPDRDLSTDLKSPDSNVKANVGRALAHVWTSLPSGIESSTTGNKFVQKLDANMKNEGSRSDASAGSDGAAASSDGDFSITNPLTLPKTPVGTPATAGGEMTHKVEGNIQTNINLNGAPPGTTFNSTSSGNGMGGAPRVSVAMPSYPSP
jgi:muramidase (phage lysozyme)